MIGFPSCPRNTVRWPRRRGSEIRSSNVNLRSKWYGTLTSIDFFCLADLLGEDNSTGQILSQVVNEEDWSLDKTHTIGLSSDRLGKKRRSKLGSLDFLDFVFHRRVCGHQNFKLKQICCRIPGNFRYTVSLIRPEDFQWKFFIKLRIHSQASGLFLASLLLLLDSFGRLLDLEV